MPGFQPSDSSATARFVELAANGDRSRLGAEFQGHRDRLRRMVALRMDPRLRGRLDPSDVIQEAFVEATARLDEYVRAPSMPFFLWLRLIAAQRLKIAHREHLGTQMRDAAREQARGRVNGPLASSESLADFLVGRESRPSEAAFRAERKRRLEAALEAMHPLDREVLALRHFERLTRHEASEVLGASPAAVAQRYLRALKKLKTILEAMPGGLEELRP